MQAVESLFLDIQARGADATLRNVESGLRRTGDRAVTTEQRLHGVSQANRRLASTSQRVDRALMSQVRQLAGVAAAAVGVHQAIRQTTQAVRTFIEFENTMARVLAISGATEKQFRQLEDQAKSLGATTLFTASQAAEAQALLAQAGFQVNEILQTMPGLLDLALSGQLDLARATEITAGSLRAFQLEARETGRVADVFARAANTANINVEKLSEGMKFVGPTAAALGMSIEETAAALQVMSDKNIQATMGGRGLRTLLSQLLDPTDKMTAAFQKLNIDLDKINPATNSIVEIFQEFHDKGLDATTAAEAFSTQTLNVALALTPSVDRMRDLNRELDNAGGESRRVGAIMESSLQGQLKALTSAAESAQIAFGEGLQPAIEEVAESLTTFFRDSAIDARDFGEAVGDAIQILLPLLLAFMRNIDVLTTAIKIYVGLKILSFLDGQIARLTLLSTATGTAATTTTALGGAVARTTPIIDQYGRTVGFADASTNALAGSQVAAAGSSKSFVGLGLTPLALKLGIVAGALLIANNRVQRWSRRLSQEIDSIAQDANAFGESMELIQDRVRQLTDESIRAAEVEKRLRQRGIEAGSDEAARVALQVALDFRRQQVDLESEYRDALATATKELEEQQTRVNLLRGELNQAADAKERLTRQQDQGFLGGLFDLPDLDVLEVVENMDSLQRVLTSAESEANRTKTEVTLLQRALEQLGVTIEQMPGEDDPAPGAPKVDQDEIDRIRELQERMAETRREAELQIAAFDAVSAAYGESFDAGERETARMEREATIRETLAEFSELQTDALERLLRQRARSEATATGARNIADLKRQIAAQEALANAHLLGERAVAEQTVANEAAERQHQATAGAAESQEEMLRRLAAELARLENQNQKLGEATELERHNERLHEMIAAYREGPAAVDKLVASQKVSEAVHRATAGAVGELRDRLAEAARHQVGNQAILAAEKRLANLEEEVGKLEAVNAIKREDFETETEYREAIRAVNEELAVRNALRAVEANRLTALAALKQQDFASEQAFLAAIAEVNAQFAQLAQNTEAAVRKQSQLRDQTDDGTEATEDLNSAWIELGQTIQQVASRMSEGLGDVVGQVIAIVQGLEAVDKASGPAEKAVAGMGVGLGVAGIAQSLGLFKGQRGTGSFGGKLSGDYSDIGGAIGGAIGAMTPLGPVGAVIGSVLGTLVGGAIKSGADEGLGELQLAGEEVAVRITKMEGGLGQVVGDLGQQVADAINSVMDQVGGEIQGLPGVQFKIRDDVITVFVNGMRRQFSEISEAAGFAVAQALTTAEVTGISPTVQAALRDRANDSVEDLFENITDAIKIDDLGLSDATTETRDSLRGISIEFDRLIAKMQDWKLGIEDFRKVGTELFAGGFQAARDSITGVVQDEREIFEDRRAIFNAQLTLQRSELESEADALRMRITLAQQHLAIQEANLTAEQTFLRGLGEFAQGIGLAAKGITATAAFTQGQIEAWIKRLAALDAALEGLPDIISADEFRPRGGGGGRRQQRLADEERLSRMLDDADLRRASDFEQSLADINRRWDDAIPLAHDNAELLDRIAEARQTEIEALQRQAREDLAARIDEFAVNPFTTTDLGESISQVREEAQALSDELRDTGADIGLTSDEVEDGLKRVSRALDLHLRRISLEGFANLAGSLAEVVQDDQIRQELLQQAEIVKFNLEMFHYREQFEILKELGRLSAQQIEVLQAAFDWIDDNLDRLPGGENAPPGTRSSTTTRTTTGGGQDPRATALQDMLQQMAEWTKAGLDPMVLQAFELRQSFEQTAAAARRFGFSTDELRRAFDTARGAFIDDALDEFRDSDLGDLARDLRDLNRQFAHMGLAFETLGATAAEMQDLNEAHLAALSRFWERATEGAQELLDRLQFDDPSIPSRDRFSSLRERFEAAAQRALAGDVDAIGEATRLGEQLQELGVDFFGTSTGAYRSLIDELQTTLQAIIAQGPPDPETVDIPELQLDAQREQLDILAELLAETRTQTQVIQRLPREITDGRDPQIDRLENGLALGPRGDDLLPPIQAIEPAVETSGRRMREAVGDLMSPLQAIVPAVFAVESRVGQAVGAIEGLSATIGVGLPLGTSALGFTGPGGMDETSKLKAEVDELRSEIRQERRRNDQLVDEMRDLNKGFARLADALLADTRNDDRAGQRNTL